MHPDFPLPDPEWAATRPFWDGAARGELVLPRCDHCRAFVWYPRPHCDDEALRWEPVGGAGTLFAWTVVRHPFLPQFRDLVPYVPALVAIDEDPAVRVVTRIVGCAPDDLRIDLPVRVVFDDMRFPGVERSVRAPFFTPA